MFSTLDGRLILGIKMSKYTTLFLVMMCLLQVGCSLGPSAANLSYKAFDLGEYRESLRLIDRALNKYEYSVQGEANLWILKVDNYTQLKQYSHAYGALRYIINTYPNTEAYYRAKLLLVSVSKIIEKASLVQPPNKTKHSIVELTQRKLVSRFFQVLEVIPKRCPRSVQSDFLKSVAKFREEFSEFNELLNKSNFRSYAIENFSQSMKLSNKECRYYKSAIDRHIDTFEGRKEAAKYLATMKNEG